MGDYNRPLSLNRWIYVDGNPINYTDPTGQTKYKRYDRDKAVAYAMTWVTGRNPYYGAFKDNDCTNFVSQGLLTGGMPEDESWFFDRRAVGPNRRCSGFKYLLYPESVRHNLLYMGVAFCGNAWAVTDDLYDNLLARGFSKHEIRGSIPPLKSSDLKFDDPRIDRARDTNTGNVIPNPLQMDKYGNFNFSSYNIKRGDVVFYYQSHSGWEGDFNHAAIVVGSGPLTDKANLKELAGKTAPIVAEHSGGYESALGGWYNIHSINDTWSEVNRMVIIHIPDFVPIPEEINYACP
jgi:hypothetical protein